MSRRALVLLIAVWCGSLLAVAEWAGAQLGSGDGSHCLSPSC